MILIRALSLSAVTVMVGIILFGITTGDFGTEASEIAGLAWGKVTLVDLYVGLALFAGWIALRERGWWRTVIWWLALIVLGNLATALYVAIASFRSRDLPELLIGDRGAGEPIGS
jgi:hypothetical protein